MLNSARILINFILIVFSAAYPLLWLFAAAQQPALLSNLLYFLALLWGIKGILQKTGGQRTIAFVMAGLLTLIALTRTIGIMYWYPVLINGGMLMLFGGSLLTSRSAVERLARVREPDLSPRAVIYTRKVTLLWCGFFLFNIIVNSLFVVSHQYDYWAWFSGVISYILMGLLMGCEWYVRQQIINKSHT